MERLLILLVTIAVTLLAASGVAFGASPPVWSHTVDGPPSRLEHEAEPPAPPWALAVRLASATAGTGVVQGHILGYDPVNPVSGARVTVFAEDDQRNFIWSTETTTNEGGFYSVSGVPSTPHGGIVVDLGDKYWAMKDLVFVDPGTSTCDLTAGWVAWSAARGGPWGSDWRNPHVEVAGLSTTGAPVYAWTSEHGVSQYGTANGQASALPGYVHLVEFSYWSNELSLWDAAETGEPPVGVSGFLPSTLPFTFNEASAYRIWIERPYWNSGKPGTVMRLLLQNFPAGTTVQFDGDSHSPSGVETTWGDRSYTSTGLKAQAVSLRVPVAAASGHDFHILVWEPVLRYGSYYLGLDAYFQVCTLNASKTSIGRGSAVRLSGVVPVQGHEGDTAGTPKYVWIYKRTTAASAAPTNWYATRQGWTLVARVRTDGYGRYRSAWLTPSRTTWYVARYEGDDWYWRAYTSVRKVRVD